MTEREDALRSILKELSEESLTSFPLTECTIQEISAEKAAYCLGDPDIMEKQIEEVMKYRIIADKVEDVLTRFQSAGDAVDLLGDEEKKKEALEAAKEEMRTSRMHFLPYWQAVKKIRLFPEWSPL